MMKNPRTHFVALIVLSLLLANVTYAKATTSSR